MILRVWWSLYEMDDDTARLPSTAKKEYKKTRMQSDFHETVHPDDAIAQLGEKYGFRPITAYSGHSFALIHGWRYLNLFTPEPTKEEVYTQQQLKYDNTETEAQG